jgi:hypothetical protein
VPYGYPCESWDYAAFIHFIDLERDQPWLIRTVAGRAVRVTASDSPPGPR